MSRIKPHRAPRYHRPAVAIRGDIVNYYGPAEIVPSRIRKKGLTYVLKSGTLITGTQTVKATYRLEGQSDNAKSK